MRNLLTGLLAIAAMTMAGQAAPNLEFSIGLCAAKADARERLACYDAIAAGLRAGESAATAPTPMVPAPAPTTAPTAPAPFAAVPPPAAAPVPAPVASVPQQPEAQFGAESLRREARDTHGQPEPLDEIHGVIAQLAFSPNGRAILTLDNGQVWRQLDGDTDRFKGKGGDKITIARAILGSYSLSIEGRTQLIKVRRVR